MELALTWTYLVVLFRQSLGSSESTTQYCLRECFQIISTEVFLHGTAAPETSWTLDGLGFVAILSYSIDLY
jgi:hypothetical protein